MGSPDINEVVPDSEEERDSNQAQDDIANKSGINSDVDDSEPDKFKQGTLQEEWDEGIQHLTGLLGIKPNLEFSRTVLTEMDLCPVDDQSLNETLGECRIPYHFTSIMICRFRLRNGVYYRRRTV